MNPNAITRICKKCGAPTQFYARRLCSPCYAYGRRLGDFDTTKKPSLRESHVDTSGEKCRCGLRLPCFDCLPSTATEYAFTRMYAPEAT